MLVGCGLIRRNTFASFLFTSTNSFTRSNLYRNAKGVELLIFKMMARWGWGEGIVLGSFGPCNFFFSSRQTSKIFFTSKNAALEMFVSILEFFCGCFPCRNWFFSTVCYSIFFSFFLACRNFFFQHLPNFPSPSIPLKIKWSPPRQWFWFCSCYSFCSRTRLYPSAWWPLAAYHCSIFTLMKVPTWTLAKTFTMTNERSKASFHIVLSLSPLPYINYCTACSYFERAS